jgi:hypothetical protein
MPIIEGTEPTIKPPAAAPPAPETPMPEAITPEPPAVVAPRAASEEMVMASGPLPDDDLGRDYLVNRENAEVRAAEEYLDGLVKEEPEALADEAPAIPDNPEAPPPERPATNDDPTVWDTTKEIAGQAIKGVVEAPLQVVGGAIDATNETVEAFFSLGQWLREKAPYLAVGEAEGSHGLVSFEVPEIPTTAPATTASGHMVRKIAQFLTGFLPANRAMKALKIGSTLAGAGTIVRSAAAGAIADFSVFDGQEGRLSNLIQEFPALQNPVSEYLAADPNDSQTEGRFKNAMEGLGLGAVSEGLGLGLRTLRASRMARQAAKESGIIGKAKEVLEEASAEDLELSVQKFLGNPNGPLYSLSSRDAWGRGSKMFQWESLGGRSGAQIPAMDMPTKGGKAININFAKWNTPDDIKRITEMVAEGNADLINKARRGTVSHAESRRQAEQYLADAMGKNLEDVRSNIRGYSTPELEAARTVMISGAEKLQELSNLVKYGGPAIKNETDRLAVRIAWQHMFARLSASVNHYSGAAAEAGRALNILRETSQSTKGSRRLVEELLGRMEHGASTEELAGMALMLDSPGQVSQFAKNASKAKTSDVILEVWINALLSGPQTHAVNNLSNSLTAMWMVPERYLAAKIGKARATFGGQQHIYEGEATAQLWGMVKGAREGLSLAKKAWKTGEPSDLLTKIEARNYSSLSAEALDLSGNLGRAVDLLGNTIRMPTRALQAEDEFFKAIGYRMELHSRAYRQAAQEGLDGAGFAKRVNELIQNPPDDLHMAGVDAARYQTFTNPLEGKISQALSGSGNPALRVIFPFVRTPVNLLKFGMERTPLAPFVGRWRADIAAGGARRDLALARMSLGSLLGAVTADLTLSGKITGGGPSNPDMRQIWMDEYKPYSIRVGDEWYAYSRLDPLGMVIGMAADASTIMSQVSELDASTLAKSVAIAFSKNVTSKTWLRGLSELVNVMSNPDWYGGRWIQNLAGTIIPTGAAQINRTYFDPVLRDARSIIDGIKARVPGFSKDLPPRRNIWGEPIVLGGGLGPDIVSPIYTSKAKDDPVNQVILDNQVELKKPARSIDGVELTPHEYSRYVELAGNKAKGPDGLGLKDKLDQIIKTPKFKQATDGPEGGKALLIKKYVQAYRGMARAQLAREIPALAEQLERAKKERAQALTPGAIQ